MHSSAFGAERCDAFDMRPHPRMRKGHGFQQSRPAVAFATDAAQVLKGARLPLSNVQRCPEISKSKTFLVCEWRAVLCEFYDSQWLHWARKLAIWKVAFVSVERASHVKLAITWFLACLVQGMRKDDCGLVREG